MTMNIIAKLLLTLLYLLFKMLLIQELLYENTISVFFTIFLKTK